jgi:hypothetical protein
MAEYIERTEELVLAMNAGARAIENTKRYHGAVYTKDVFSENSQEIPYLLAAKVLREVSDAPAADVAPVVRCKDCKHYDLGVCLKIYSDGNEHPEAWQSRKPEDFCSYGERNQNQ